MGSLTETIVDSVKELSLNGSVKAVNGDKIVIRNICCVGAGYVGMSPLRLALVRRLAVLLRLVGQRTRRFPRRSFSVRVIPKVNLY
jgi:hypothetical protein